MKKAKEVRGIPPPPEPDQALPRFAAFAVVIIAVAACVAGLANNFTLDDIPIIRDDLRLHGLARWRDVLTSPYWPPPAAPDFYRPVTSLFLAFQHGLGAGAPVVFRLVSYALYAAVSVGVLRLASQICRPHTALAIALLFAAHPVHVEAVAAAVGQSELLLSIFATIMVARYLRYRAQPSGVPRARDWTVLAFLYFFACLAKEQGLLLPALLLAAESVVVAGGSLQTRIRGLWKGYTALAVTGVVVIAIRTSVLGGHFGPPVTSEALAGAGLGARTLTMLQLVPEWLRLLVWPAHLRIEYRPQEFVASTAFGLREGLGLMLVVGAAAVAWMSRRRAPVVTFGILWMSVALLPVSNLLVPTFILIAERTLFLPSVGFLLAIGGGSDWVTARIARRHSRYYRLLPIAVGLLVTAGVIRSGFRHRIWRDPRTLLLASVRDSPRNWHVWQGLGDMHFGAEQPDSASSSYRRAIDLAPESWRVRNDFAMRLRLVGRDSEAVTHLRLSLAGNPDQIMPLAQLPPALIALGRYEEARHLADSIIAVANAPPLMVWLRRVADSAITAKAPAGSIRIGIGLRP